MKILNKEKGTAIIVALFIMSLITVISISMMQSLRIDLRRTELTLRATQGYFYAQGTIAWALNQLNKNGMQQKPNQLADKMPLVLAPSHEPPYTITATLTDAQGLLNINDLSDTPYQQAFLRLLQNINPTLPLNANQDLVKAIADWITPGLKETAYDVYYLKLNPPYRSAHRPMVSISELRLVKGMTPALLNQLQPYLTALPEKTQINLNNAADKIIMGLSPTMSIDTARSLALLLQKEPLADLQKLSSLAIIKNNPIPPETLTVLSNYFLLKTIVTTETQQIMLYTLFNRTVKEGKSKTIIVWQSKGTL